MRMVSLFSAIVCVALAGAQGGTEGVKKELAALAKLEKTYVSAKSRHVKAPKDAKLKKAYVDATVLYADAEMKCQALPSKERYPRALKHFREARKADPKHKYANEAIQMIESIYKSLGRPIPPG